MHRAPGAGWSHRATAATHYYSNRLLALAVAVATVGCGSRAPAPLALGWRFADGRRCADAGANRVNVTLDCGGACDPVPGFPAMAACTAGEVGASLALTVPGEANALALTAVSPGGGTLYRGDLRLDGPVPAAATVTLYFTGGP